MSYISILPSRPPVFGLRCIRNRAIAGAMGCLALLASPVAAQTVENPPTHTASSILPKNLVSGPDFTVRQQVANDGALYIYMIDSPYGAFQAVGTARR